MSPSSCSPSNGNILKNLSTDATSLECTEASKRLLTITFNLVSASYRSWNDWSSELPVISSHPDNVHIRKNYCYHPQLKRVAPVAYLRVIRSLYADGIATRGSCSKSIVSLMMLLRRQLVKKLA